MVAGRWLQQQQTGELIPTSTHRNRNRQFVGKFAFGHVSSLSLSLSLSAKEDDNFLTDLEHSLTAEREEEDGEEDTSVADEESTNLASKEEKRPPILPL